MSKKDYQDNIFEIESGLNDKNRGHKKSILMELCPLIAVFLCTFLFSTYFEVTVVKDYEVGIVYKHSWSNSFGELREGVLLPGFQVVFGKVVKISTALQKTVFEANVYDDRYDDKKVSVFVNVFYRLKQENIVDSHKVESIKRNIIVCGVEAVSNNFCETFDLDSGKGLNELQNKVKQILVVDERNDYVDIQQVIITEIRIEPKPKYWGGF